MGLTVVLGGARSGKSAWAEALVADLGLPVRYVATADAGSGMEDRIARHVTRRPTDWETVVAGPDLAGVLGGEEAVLVDGLGVWLASALHHGWPEPLARVREMVDAAATRAAPVVLVIEEAGAGVLPADPETRAWVDLLGEAAQLAAAGSEHAVLVVAGRPVALPAVASFRAPAPLSRHGDLRVHGDRLIPEGAADHAVNVMAGGPPPWLRAALHDALDADGAAYPREDDAVIACAARHGRTADEVVVTNGAAEALWLLPAALRPRHAAVIHPGFTESEAALHAHGVPVTRVLRDPAAGFAIDPSAVPADADLVIVGNPASPSGTLAPAAAILALRRRGRTVVVDEAFMDLVPGEPGSLAGDPLDDVIVVRSLTKALAVPGLRVGYALAPPPLAAALRAVRPPWSANAVALAALRAAAANPAELAAIAERARAERQDLERRLDGAGIRRFPSAANFVLIEVPDGPAALARAHAAGIAVRPCATFPGLTAHHLRVTARDPSANARVAEVLE
ncbi:bifunctional adenosylcobinamide kinase/adenosylcobinamide-phosphate guanylyltransferase [Svornostia abyssi]|uniref:Aminotransferase n=1 Tax=Svornostia abyssi TaxID=2898438 RepID=A0ABY5PFG4_9ACTN|nr:bifunctional adenosylcobinamide kinase/adenosylcobinamide-phosphate guanylyltransferase [Parviterribacteraceae bacterium J379]